MRFPGSELPIPGWETAFSRAELAFPGPELPFPRADLPIPTADLAFPRGILAFAGQEIADSGQRFVVSEAGNRHKNPQIQQRRHLMAEGQVLLNSINVGCANQLRIAQASPTFWILALQQMPSAGASSRDFAVASDLEPFAHGLPRLNSFGPPHKFEFVDL